MLAGPKVRPVQASGNSARSSSLRQPIQVLRPAIRMASARARAASLGRPMIHCGSRVLTHGVQPDACDRFNAAVISGSARRPAPRT